MNKAQKTLYTKMKNSGPQRVSNLSGGSKPSKQDGNGVNPLTGFAKSNAEVDADVSPKTQPNKRVGKFVPKASSTKPGKTGSQKVLNGGKPPKTFAVKMGKGTMHKVPSIKK